MTGGRSQKNTQDHLRDGEGGNPLGAVNVSVMPIVCHKCPHSLTFGDPWQNCTVVQK